MTMRIFSVLSMLILMGPQLSAAVPSKSTGIQYVGSISINPCHEAKVLAGWYSRFGFELQEYRGLYFAQIETATGPFAFGIHPKKPGAKCSGSVSVVYRVKDFDESLSALKANGLLPDSTEKDEQGRFAHFHDPDGNEVTIWAD